MKRLSMRGVWGGYRERHCIFSCQQVTLIAKKIYQPILNLFKGKKNTMSGLMSAKLILSQL